MRRQCVMVLVLTLLLGMVGRAAADDASGQPSFAFNIYMENDSPYFKPGSDEDRYYTHGTKITLTHQPRFGHELARTLRRWIPLGGDEPMRSAVGYVAGQEIFTPDDITIAAPQPEDRPWAGWLYGGAYLQRAAGDRVFDHFELNVGVVGPSSLADEAQDLIHDWFDADEPAGWDNQLPDEFGIDFIYRRKWKFTLHGENQGDLTIEAIPQAGLTLGNVHRHVGGDIVLRAGLHLPEDFGPGRIDDVIAATGGATHPWGVYGFVRAGGRYVDHNVFLEGSNYHDSLGVEEEPWVGELETGVHGQWRNWIVSWSVRWVSEQFEGQDGTHAFGTWMVSYAKVF